MPFEVVAPVNGKSVVQSSASGWCCYVSLYEMRLYNLELASSPSLKYYSFTLLYFTTFL